MYRWKMAGSLAVLFTLAFLSGCRSEADLAPTETLAPASSTATVADETPSKNGPPDGEELVTLDVPYLGIDTLDPQVSGGGLSVAFIENMFVQLTESEPGTGELRPEAAKGWENSEDGLVYTFHLRNDIPWIHHDPGTGQMAQVTDGDGRPRFVTAGDFVNAIRRVCDAELGSYYSGIIGRVIAGCEELLRNEDPDQEQALLEALGATAPDDETLVVTLKYPAGYFINMTTLWTLSAIPSWTIEEHGNLDWYQAGNIVTNGRYALTEWNHGLRLVLERNPFMPPDMKGEGNIDRVVGHAVPDDLTAYFLWTNNEIDVSDVPDAEMSSHLEKYANQTVQNAGGFVFYVGYANTKPPFDDARVRRAFSAAIDRETLTTNVLGGRATPMIHLAPPDNFGAPPIDEVGVGFDPEYAREQLAAAGYPNCGGFPPITLLRFDWPELLTLAEYLQLQWEEHLGCPSQTVQIQHLEPSSFFEALSTSRPLEEMPHMHILGWAADYADENNWVGDVLSCKNAQSLLHRPCGPVDELILEAAADGDPNRRIELYRDIEESFFGPQGEMPMAPLYQLHQVLAIHDWLDSSRVATTNQWYRLDLDWQAKQQAQE